MFYFMDKISLNKTLASQEIYLILCVLLSNIKIYVCSFYNMLPKKKNIVLLFLYYLMLLIVELFVVFAEVQTKLAT